MVSRKSLEHTRLEDLQLLLLGAGGHASVLHDMLLALGYPPKGVIDATLEAGATWESLPVLGDDDLLATFSPEEFALVNGLGASPNCIPRNRLYERFRTQGFFFPPLVHPSAVLAHNVVLHPGCQIMAGAILQSGVIIGENSVINTRASIDHHCSVASGVFISPGAVLCGNVSIGEGAFIGAGAVLLPGISVGEGSIVGAGAVVLKNVAKNSKVTGSPAKIGGLSDF